MFYEKVWICVSIYKKLFGARSENHRQIINEYAEKGYRFIACIPTKINGNGVIINVDKIIEKDVE